MNRLFSALSMLLLLAGPGLPGVIAQTATTVLADQVLLRSRPSFDGEIVTRFAKGQTVTLLDPAQPAAQSRPGRSWSRVSVPPGTPVWVSETHLDPATGAVRTRRLNVRAGPSEDYGVLGTVDRGIVLVKLGVRDGWWRVEAPAGLAGYVATEFLEAGSGERRAASSGAPPIEPQSGSAPGVAGSPDSAALASPEVPASAVGGEPQAVPAVPGSPAVAAPARVSGGESVAPAGPRRVQREGVVTRTLSIQAPTDFELRATDTGRRLNYLWPGSTNLQLRAFRGARVRVTGEEYFDARWPITPMIRVEHLILAP